MVARGSPDPSQGQRETQAKKKTLQRNILDKTGRKEEEEGRKEEEEVKLIRERRGGEFEQGQCEERAGELHKTTTNSARWGELRGGKEREEHGREKYFH